jgi:D-alanine-D-alanine ligase-like ATP-grasp enzyme
VQQACTGTDYRIIVLDNEILCAYRREPLGVIGDGQSSIRELLDNAQEAFEKEGRDTIIPLEDERILATLKRYKLQLSSILPAGRAVTLLDVANLSLGGMTKDITDTINPECASICIQAARDMDLRFCGVDLITEDATLPLTNYAILEINSAPGLDNYLFSGVQQQDYVDGLYLKVLNAIMNGP